MQELELNKQVDMELFPALKAPFWKRQFRASATGAQKVFDWLFGVILPVVCCLLDPLVFKGAFLPHGASLGEYNW